MAKRRAKKGYVLVKPSDLPKDFRTSIRINAKIKELLEKEGSSVQAVLDEALDKKFSRVEIEIEKKINIEPKKTNK